MGRRHGQYEDLVKSGVIDPTKASIAGLLLTTECVIADRPEMGGMG